MCFRFILICLMMVAHLAGFSQIKVNLHNSWGHNFVDLEKATGSPEYSKKLPADSRQLVDWGRFYYNGEVQVFKSMNDRVDVGLGVGFNRLYYWEERYRNLFDTQYQFDYGTIWTFEVSALTNFYFENWFISASAGMHNFMSEGETTAGISVGAGRIVQFNDLISIPIVLNHDMVFGDGTTLALSAGLGIMLTF